MNCLRFVTCATACAALLVATTGSVHADEVFNDSFADGDRAETNSGGENDTSWWTSSSSSGDELNIGPPNTLGLVTGSSGRGLHTVFATQTLSTVGDMLTATYTFTTPTTIGSGNSSFRVGLFDTLGRAGLNADVSASSGTPNPLYGDTGIGGTEIGLPGYMLDMDVNPATASDADLNFRTHNVGSATGRLMATTGSGSFSSFSSGPDAGYTFDPNTEYTGSFSIERISATELQLTGTLDGETYSIIDDTFTSDSFGFLGFHVNSNQFGSSNTAGEADNGIDFSNIRVDFVTAVPEPSSAALLISGLFAMGLIRRRS